MNILGIKWPALVNKFNDLKPTNFKYRKTTYEPGTSISDLIVESPIESRDLLFAELIYWGLKFVREEIYRRS